MQEKLDALSAASAQSTRIIRMRTLTERVGLSRSEIYRRIGAGTFVKPIALGPRAVGWREADIEAWLASLTKRGEA
ncbi:helix-turn-helix transcriptional regulator [Burkholderia cepacia]|uniref:helix-turn-helix transcriptional regulator n=1 Tax=Burkholderia cepacia TaxID=292 RepID=UPI00201A09EF|nr:AlpA family transcriptional regulator [Burkholderia cepacia]UQO33878.1 AlpA family transcriptional regulator [Burkholderia cepacia]UQO47631.1 AlpA family transcriptional regulator [Burkholderia cepacia]UQP08427.1 AlpA family transcriptional regulator [Burkholderia cepacia]